MKILARYKLSAVRVKAARFKLPFALRPDSPKQVNTHQGDDKGKTKAPKSYLPWPP